MSISCPSAGTGCEQRRGRAELAHVVDRDDDLEVELLARAGVDERDRPAAARRTGRSPRAAAASPTARCAASAARRALEPLDRERQVRAALRAGDRVHLVEDQRLDRAQRLARLRGEHQVERLRRRDQDVGRLLEQLAALLLRRVAGAHGDAHLRLEARERPAQVALDVVVERLQRRDVEHAQALRPASRLSRSSA